VGRLLLWLTIAAIVFSFVHGRWRKSGESVSKNGEKPAIAVRVATVVAADVPIILRGLGAVTAFNTVDVRSRIVGNIVKINFREGQEVRPGDVLVEIDPRPYQATLDQAVATAARDEATLANSRVILRRYSDLVKNNYVSKQDFTTQESLVKENEATVKADQAAIAAARLNLDYCSISSPINGVTGIRQVDLGNLVQANTQTLVIVTQIKPIYVVFSLPEADIERVRDAMRKKKLDVFAYDAADERKVSTGVLKLVDNQVDQTTGTVKLKAEFANPDTALWPGQFVNAHLVLRTVKNGPTAPSAAVQAGPDGRFVYVVKADDTVEVRPTTVVQTERNVSLVTGLRVGERVVVAGQSALSPGARVSIVEGDGEEPSGEARGASLEGAGAP
jgi:multidrug efflux system membrane fusion protein